jgi:hypothetical protein
VGVRLLSLTGNTTLIDGKQLAAVCRIKPLRRLHCCALPVCGFGDDRYLSNLWVIVDLPLFPSFGCACLPDLAPAVRMIE